MKISELVTLLETAKQEHGDVDVYCERDAGIGEPYEPEAANNPQTVEGPKVVVI